MKQNERDALKRLLAYLEGSEEEGGDLHHQIVRLLLKSRDGQQVLLDMEYMIPEEEIL